MSARRECLIDFTSKDYASLRQAMLELAKDKLPMWTDHSENDLGVLLVELFAHMADMLLYYQDRVASESFLETASERKSIVHLLRLIGYELRPAVPASADLTVLFAADASGTVIIPENAEFKTTKESTGEAVPFLYEGVELVVNVDTLPAEYQHTDGKTYKRYPTTLPVRQVARRVTGDVVASSDGSAGQRYALGATPVIPGSVDLEVDEGNADRNWTRVDHFLDSGPSDKHYIIRRDHEGMAWVEFGDGVYGKVPRRGRNNVSVGYLVGGGSMGNVPPRTITKVVTDGLNVVVFNGLAASGGADGEDTSDAAKRGPQLYRTMGRAVTASDYEAHAKQFGVAKARARAPGWNRVELYIAPEGGGEPSDLLKQELLAYFENRRVMGTALEILGPDYVLVTVEADLEVQPYFFADQVEQQVRDAVAELLSFDQVTFEKPLYLSKLYETIEAVDGVRSVFVRTFARDGDEDAIRSDGRLDFGWSEIPRFEEIHLTTTGGESLG
jgi:uncharacterized phage protein gp47/JayE